MPLVRYADWISQKRNIGVPHRGFVQKNDDPKKIGRIKVSIPNMLNVDVDSLPWIYPLQSAFLGARVRAASFAVPQMGSHVAVVFPFDNIYFGFYIGLWYSEFDKVPNFDQDYPKTYGFVDCDGDYALIDMNGDTCNININGDTNVHIGGNLYADIDGNATVDIGGDLSATVLGKADIESRGPMILVGNPVEINPGG